MVQEAEACHEKMPIKNKPDWSGSPEPRFFIGVRTIAEKPDYRMRRDAAVAFQLN
jgi:hypothetical protein